MSDRSSQSATLHKLHDRLGAMIDQIGQPDYSLRELVNGLREVRDALLTTSAARRSDVEVIDNLLDKAKSFTLPSSTAEFSLVDELTKRLAPSSIDALIGLLREIQSNAAIGEPDWDSIEIRITATLHALQSATGSTTK